MAGALEHAVSAVRYFRKHHGRAAAAVLFLGLGVEFAAKALHGSFTTAFGRPGASATEPGAPNAADSDSGSGGGGGDL